MDIDKTIKDIEREITNLEKRKRQLLEQKNQKHPNKKVNDFLIRYNGSILLSKHKLDEVANWKHDNEREYDIPQLKNDHEAWAKAKAEGFILNDKGQILGRLK